MKDVLAITPELPRHWVGNGFPVRSLFAHSASDHPISPFVLLDHAGPHDFAAAERPRGVGAHPHRGFETVTIVYDGEVEHRDTSGAGGRIGAGDVQWMTAGAGIVHDELHSAAFTHAGGRFEMAQLWVNLPARAKDTAPGYQAIRDADIPVVELADGEARARVIAGAFGDQTGPAHTHTPLSVVDLRLAAGARVHVPMTAGWTGLLAVLTGSVRVNDSAEVAGSRGVHLTPAGDGVRLEAVEEAKVLLLEGEPIDEPVVAHGPFVMNTRAEISQAIADFQAGRYGQLTA